MHLPGPKAISATFQRPAANNGNVRACQERSGGALLKANARQSENERCCQFFLKPGNSSCCSCRNFSCHKPVNKCQHFPHPPPPLLNVLLSSGRLLRCYHEGDVAPQKFMGSCYVNLLHHLCWCPATGRFMKVRKLCLPELCGFKT